MKKQLVIDIACYLIIILFTYAALNKLFLFDVYLYDLGRSPYIGFATPVLSILIPTVELVLSVMLIFQRTRTLALLGSFILMLMFTLYVGAIILFTTGGMPCTCGGLIKELSWRQHFLLNAFYTALALYAYFMNRRKQKGGSDTRPRLSVPA